MLNLGLCVSTVPLDGVLRSLDEVPNTYGNVIFSRLSKLVISFAGLNSPQKIKKLPVSNIMIIPPTAPSPSDLHDLPRIPVNRPVPKKEGDLLVRTYKVVIVILPVTKRSPVTNQVDSRSLRLV